MNTPLRYANTLASYVKYMSFATNVPLHEFADFSAQAVDFIGRRRRHRLGAVEPGSAG